MEEAETGEHAMALCDGEIFCDLDFERPGRQVSFLRLAHSDDAHAYGTIPIPITVIAKGQGPTVLLTAGNHGDEYEGQVILGRLIREIEPESLNGRLIILPALNAPAALAGTRVSPLDGLNLNRSFPGDPAGPPTRSIAYFVDSVLLPLSDAGIDLHSGGSLSEYLPLAFLCTTPDPGLMARLLDMAEAFAAPHTLVVDGAGAPRGLDPVAHRRGVALISAELAGGASIGREAQRIGTAGVLGVLRHVGVLAADSRDRPAPGITRFLRARDERDYVFSPVSGLFEPYCGLGETVREGQPAGAVHSMEDPARPAETLVFDRPGLIVSRRVPARVKRGDYVFQVAEEITREEVSG